MSEYFVSVVEFGRRFGLSRSTAYQLTGNGTVHTVPVGSRRLVPVVEMERYAAQLLAEAGIEPATQNEPALDTPTRPNAVIATTPTSITVAQRADVVRSVA